MVGVSWRGAPLHGKRVDVGAESMVPKGRGAAAEAKAIEAPEAGDEDAVEGSFTEDNGNGA